MRKSILVVEDDARMREIISDYYIQEGFEFLQTENGHQAIEIFENNQIDIVLLDIMIPGLDGWSVCKRIRKKSDVPIIMITAKSDEDDKLMGYELGADDYITKPFSPKVLVAKTKMLLKRVEGSVGKADGTLCLAGIEVNKFSRTVKIENQLINLTPKEHDLLLYLMENKGRVLSRENILNNVWGYEYFGDLRAVDTNIKRLRAKLEDKARHICTMIRSGYKFEVEQ